MTPVTPEPLADSFDSPDGRTCSGPVTNATPGQAVLAVMARRLSADNDLDLTTWDELDEDDRQLLEDAGQAAIDVFLAGDSVSAGSIREAIAAQDARPAPGDDAATATPVYLEAIGILSAGLRDIRDANPDAPAGGYARERAVLALNLADHVQPPAQPAPGCPDPSQHRDVYGRLLPRAEPAPGDPSVLDITGEVLTAAVQGKRILLQLGSKPGPQPAPELAEAIRAYCQQEAAEFSAEMFPVRPQDMRVSAGDILAIVDRVQPATAAPELAAAMAESKRYREALEKVAGGEVGKGIADLRKIAVRALEGK